VFVAGLLLLSGLIGLLAAVPPVLAAAPPVQIIQVVDGRAVADESFQLYNNSNRTVTLDGYQICPGNSACIAIPTTSVEAFRWVEIAASRLTGWPASGLNGANEMLGLLDPTGKAMDAVNWGTPNPSWRNYAAFRDMLYNPGITPPAPTGKQSFFRVAPGLDNETVRDWLATPLSNGAEVTATPATPAATTRTATPRPATTPARTPTPGGATVDTTPTTGGEFPFLVTVALVVAVLAVRYLRLRRGTSPR
jgi:hypothetical protein